MYVYCMEHEHDVCAEKYCQVEQLAGLSSMVSTQNLL